MLDSVRPHARHWTRNGKCEVLFSISSLCLLAAFRAGFRAFAMVHTVANLLAARYSVGLAFGPSRGCAPPTRSLGKPSGVVELPGALRRHGKRYLTREPEQIRAWWYRSNGGLGAEDEWQPEDEWQLLAASSTGHRSPVVRRASRGKSVYRSLGGRPVWATAFSGNSAGSLPFADALFFASAIHSPRRRSMADDAMGV